MKRVNLSEIMTEEVMAIITDEDNNHVYYTDNMLSNSEMSNAVLETKMKVNLKASREEQDEAVDKFITLLYELNNAFNRSVGAPASMRLFKVLDKKYRYSGNDTVSLELDLATLATGAGSAIYVLLDACRMFTNIWKTNANIMTASSNVSDKTYGLGNSLRSWKAVLNKIWNQFNTESVNC